jgi:hypothetical protein
VSPCNYDSEDATSLGSQTTDGSTHMKICGSFSVSGAGRQANGTLTTVRNLMKLKLRMRLNRGSPPTPWWRKWQNDCIHELVYVTFEKFLPFNLTMLLEHLIKVLSLCYW